MSLSVFSFLCSIVLFLLTQTGATREPDSAAFADRLFLRPGSFESVRRDMRNVLFMQRAVPILPVYVEAMRGAP